MRHLIVATMLLCCCLAWPARAQSTSDPSAPLPDTLERVPDLFGNEARLYFDLPANSLVFLDTATGVYTKLALDDDGRTAMMNAYMKAGNRLNSLKSGEKDEGFSVTLSDSEVTFKAAHRDNRSWVVIYVTGPVQQKTRYAVPQQFDIKDPKAKQLFEIKRGFERLLIKSTL